MSNENQRSGFCAPGRASPIFARPLQGMMVYGQEIDGLRAIAVLSVIRFHVGLRPFSGGFIGVDVFFVISGYLITSILIAERARGPLRVADFYERRARRILPALFVVLLACLPFAWVWLTPSDLQDFSQSLVAVSAFVSNIFFYLKSGYFDSDADLQPLLHTWSLAVEEQYYLLFPLFLLVTWRLGKRWVVGALVVIALLSLAAAEWGSVRAPGAAFYLLPSRAWELAIGAILALCLRPNPDPELAPAPARRALREAATLTGAAMIGYSVVHFDKYTPFPGVYALIPATGAVLLIAFATPATFVGRLLSTRVMVGIGLISYSAYLWHQPLFAFARMRELGQANVQVLLLLAFFSLGLAYLSWRYVESPLRNRSLFSRNTVFAGALLLALGISGAGVVGYAFGGFADRLSAPQRELNAYIRYDPDSLYRNGTCFLLSEQSFEDFAAECAGGLTNNPGLLVWGDSHAAALAVGLRSARPDLAQYTAAACPPLIGAALRSQPRCKGVNDFVVSQIARLKPRQIVLHANWLFYVRRKQANPSMDIAKTIDAIRMVSRTSRIYVVGGVPQWAPNLPERMLRMHIPLRPEEYMETPVRGIGAVGLSNRVYGNRT